jgi:hypothetical protein
VPTGETAFPSVIPYFIPNTFTPHNIKNVLSKNDK